VTLEGWVPQTGEYLTLAEVIEFAFDYRGNTTIVKTDGTEVEGYVFNRDRNVPAPFIQFFDDNGEGPFTLPYSEIANIRFTGKDTAAGNSWKAWLERKDKDRPVKAASGEPRRAPGADPHGR